MNTIYRFSWYEMRHFSVFFWVWFSGFSGVCNFLFLRSDFLGIHAELSSFSTMIFCFHTFFWHMRLHLKSLKNFPPDGQRSTSSLILNAVFLRRFGSCRLCQARIKIRLISYKPTSRSTNHELERKSKKFWKISTKFWRAKIFFGVIKLPKL